MLVRLDAAKGQLDIPKAKESHFAEADAEGRGLVGGIISIKEEQDYESIEAYYLALSGQLRE